MDSRSPLFARNGKLRVKCPTIIQQGGWRIPSLEIGHTSVTTFEFYRFRFHFRALERVHFPRGMSANVVRGTFGALLRQSAPPLEYARLFEPGTALAKSPSGLADWPRPLVFRTAHLDGLVLDPGAPFFLDLHVFDVRPTVLGSLRTAFSELAHSGIGPGRGRAELDRIEQFDLDDRSQLVDREPVAPSSVFLEPGVERIDRAIVRFITATELKSQGGTAAKPDFPILFGRLRDRISTLRNLYGAGPLAIDFRGMGDRAAGVCLVRLDLQWERVIRRSARTGQVHPLGGFTGEAEYQGDLSEFLPWLRVGRWVGVGRHTVWGKGDFRVVT